jgi:hypothetical protein
LKVQATVSGVADGAVQWRGVCRRFLHNNQSAALSMLLFSAQLTLPSLQRRKSIANGRSRYPAAEAFRQIMPIFQAKQ